MKKPTEQQLKDPKWWDENAPEGSNYYAYGSIEPFEKFDGHGWFWFDRDVDTWFEMPCKTMADREKDSDMRFYKRPKHHTQWKGPQDGLPPEGTECEFKSLGHHSKPDFQWCIFRGLMSDGGYIIEYHHHTSPSRVTCSCFDPQNTTFRPIQSELDKLLNYAHNIVDKKLINNRASTGYSFSLEDIIEVLFHEGMLVDPERKPMSRAEAFEALDIETAFSHERIAEILDLLGYKD